MENIIIKNLYEILPLLFTNLSDPGLLLVSGDNYNESNVMTIGWLETGIVWGIPTLSIFIRPSRHTHKLLNKYNEFSINIMSDKFIDALKICGTKSGSYCNKFNEAKLNTCNSKKIAAMSLNDALITIECKIIHQNEVEQSRLNDLLNARYYGNDDYHTRFTAEILKINSYI